jgi:hypothetical protein
MIFWGQTAGRVADSFAHKRPFWWYLPLLPLLFFPWLLWPGLWRRLLALKRESLDGGLRFCLAWLRRCSLFFSLISGKQIHYLVPLFPVPSRCSPGGCWPAACAAERGCRPLLAAAAGAASDGRFVGLAGADAHHLLDRASRRSCRRRSCRCGPRLMMASMACSTTSPSPHDHLDLDLGQEVDHVLGAAIELGVALLTAKTLHFGHGQAGDADFGQGLAHLVELEGLDHGFDFLHLYSPGNSAAF